MALAGCARTAKHPRTTNTPPGRAVLEIETMTRTPDDAGIFDLDNEDDFFEPTTAEQFDIERLHTKIARLTRERDDLREALVLILPLAKGYAHAHKVGSNAKYVALAERVANADEETRG